MSDSDAPSEDLSSDEDMHEPVPLPASSHFHQHPIATTTVVPKTAALELPQYPHRAVVLLHKWNKYQPLVLCMGDTGILLCDWGHSVPVTVEEWPYTSIVSLTASPDDATSFSVEIQRSGLSFRNSVWTFSSTRRPFVLEHVYTYRHLQGAPKSVHFDSHLIDTAKSRHAVTVYVMLGQVKIAPHSSMNYEGRDLHVPTVDLLRVVTLTDMAQGLLLVCRSPRPNSPCLYVLEFPPERRELFVQMVVTNHARVSGCRGGDSGGNNGGGAVSALPVVSGDLVSVLSNNTTHNTHNTNNTSNTGQWDWDWSRSSPTAPSALPQQSTYDAEHMSKDGSRRRRCKLVWSGGCLLDIDVESHQVIKWWSGRQMRGLWCSERHPTRMAIVGGCDMQGIVSGCTMDVYDVMKVT